MLSYADLVRATREDAAFRRRRRLQPVGGQGDKIFPPTYPGPNNAPKHVFEKRMIGGHPVDCVLIDSVQSQANRLEEALLNAAEAGRISLPRLFVDFPGAGLNSVPAISSLDAPHRIFDAILRDSKLGEENFRDSALGKALREAKPHNATAILQASPTALLFGVWNSTGEGGGLGAKFARAIVSEIVGVNVEIGRRAGVRIDPLGTLSSVKVVGGPNDWRPAKIEKGKDGKEKEEAGAKKPSEINHSNIIAGQGKGNTRVSVWEQGVTCEYAEQTCVITLAGLRRLRFGGDVGRDDAARAYLAALGLVALAEADAQGYALRSRCDLVCEGDAPFQLIAFNGKATNIALSVEAARALHEEAFEKAKKAGFERLNSDPVKLQPQDKLLEIIRRSQEKAMADEGGEAEDAG